MCVELLVFLYYPFNFCGICNDISCFILNISNLHLLYFFFPVSC